MMILRKGEPCIVFDMNSKLQNIKKWYMMYVYVHVLYPVSK